MKIVKLFQGNLELATSDQPTDACVGAFFAAIITPKTAQIGTELSQAESPKIQSSLVTFAVWTEIG